MPPVNEVKKDEVELTVRIPKLLWETLVELSRESKHETPAQTVLLMVYDHLDPFLRGKRLGTEQGASISGDAISRVLDTVFPTTAKKSRLV